KGQRISRCPVCRVALWSNYGGGGDAVRFVRVGTLDEPDRLPPDIHIFTSSKQPWVSLPPDKPAVPGYYDREKLWREAPDVACLQELKAPDEAFPLLAIQQAGYGAVWHGQRSWNGVAILAKGSEPREIRRGLPGDPDDTHSRYLEAAVGGVIIGCLYLPNGNPQPGPKFDYKLAWFERLIQHAQTLIDSGLDVVLAGDFNVVPTNADIYN